MNPELSKALVKAQGQMGKLIKDSVNPHLKNRYASLAAVIEAIRQPLTDSDLCLYQSVSNVDGGILVRSMLIHGASGETIEEQIVMPIDRQTPQAIGSAITYGRRYLAMAMCGLAPDDDDDDDGHKASTQAKQQAMQRQAQQPPSRPPATKSNPQPTANGTANHTVKKQASPAAPIVNEDSQSTEWDAIPGAADEEKTAADLAKARKAFHAEINKHFNGDSNDARHWLVELFTKKRTPDNVRRSTNDLTINELVAIRKSLAQYADDMVAKWQAHKAEVSAITVDGAEKLSTGDPGDDYDYAAADSDHAYRYS